MPAMARTTILDMAHDITASGIAFADQRALIFYLHGMQKYTTRQIDSHFDLAIATAKRIGRPSIGDPIAKKISQYRDMIAWCEEHHKSPADWIAKMKLLTTTQLQAGKSQEQVSA